MKILNFSHELPEVTDENLINLTTLMRLLQQFNESADKQRLHPVLNSAMIMEFAIRTKLQQQGQIGFLQ